MQIVINILIGFLVINSILLVLIVLMQRPKNEGLGAAFGGGVTENIFGGQTSNVLTKFTTYLAAGFFGLSFLIAALYARVDTARSKTQQELLATPAPEEKEEAKAPAPGAEAAPAETPQPQPEGQPGAQSDAAQQDAAAAPEASPAPADSPAPGASPAP